MLRTRAEIEEAFHGSVTVGERGQVVIPVNMREKLGINPGDKLLVFSHPSGSGVLFAKLQDLQHVSELLSSILENAGPDADPSGEAANS